MMSMKMEVVMVVVAAVLSVLVVLPACVAFNATHGWQTISQGPPLVIANGGTSGLFPDQTFLANADAVNSTSFPMALLCDLQLTKDNFGICRTGWNLSDSTDLKNITSNATVMSTYVMRRESRTGFFSVDFTSVELNKTSAIQSNPSRTPGFDGMYIPETPESTAQNSADGAQYGLFFWLNVEYPTFYQQHPGKNSLASYLTTFLKEYEPEYLSATEIGILKLLKPTALKSETNLVLKFLDAGLVEESTNTTYGEIIKDLPNIATYAQGILVPKEFVYPRITFTNDTSYGYYSAPATTLVQDAHKAGLEVYVYGFANDFFPSSYNNSFDPILEVLNYVGDTFTVDGVLTDFPTTAAEAINCYPRGYKSASNIRASTKPVQSRIILSHNGASGNFPGSTLSAYVAAIYDGADYIDCTVQITSDGVPICREHVNLVKSTDIDSVSALYEQYFKSYPEFGSGVFTFDVPLTDIRTLKAKMYSPWSDYLVRRDPSNDGKENVLTLDEFLVFAKNNSGVGVYVNLQNAHYLRTQKNLDMVDTVVASLSKANLTNGIDKVYVASEDSSALAAIQSSIPLVKRVYVVQYDEKAPVSITTPVLTEIKKYADTIALDGRFVDPLDTLGSSFLLSKTSVVHSAQSLNMTVFYYFLSNEFNSRAIDYRSDPILHINSLIRDYNVNGFITDHPATLYNFLYNNYCWQLLGGATDVNLSTQLSPIFPITPSPDAPSLPPSPALSIAESPVSYSAPLLNGTSTLTPSSNPNSATKLQASLISSMALIFCLIFSLH